MVGVTTLSSQRGAYEPASCLRGSVNDTPSARRPQRSRWGGCHYEENVHSHAWDELVDVPMTRWSADEYRDAFREAGLAVAVQDNVPDREITIPPAGEFPTEDWETREAMVERYREFGTLVTVGVARDRP